MIDWVQTFTIIGSVLAAWYAFFNILRQDMRRMEERMDKNEQHWRDMFYYMNNKIDEKK